MCQRHATELWEKSRLHTVMEQRVGFVVISGESGKDYGVVQLGDGRYACTCNWQTHNPLSECSHTLAAREYVANQEGRTIRAYSAEDQFVRAHQRFETFNDGVIVASRVN